MPASPVAWIMFIFFSGGALGGWVVLWLFIREYWKDATE